MQQRWKSIKKMENDDINPHPAKRKIARIPLSEDTMSARKIKEEVGKACWDLCIALDIK